MECKCNRQKTITLVNNQQVCNYCPNHLVECEARQLLSQPLAKRRDFLEKAEKKRGSVENVKNAMMNIWNKL